MCEDDFQHNERVYRLECDHVAHKECYDDYVSGEHKLNRDGNIRCCNCLGPGSAKSLYNYPGYPRNQAIESARLATQRFYQQEANTRMHAVDTPTDGTTPTPPRATFTFYTEQDERDRWYSGSDLPCDEWCIQRDIDMYSDVLDPVLINDFTKLIDGCKCRVRIETFIYSFLYQNKYVYLKLEYSRSGSKTSTLVTDNLFLSPCFQHFLYP